MTSEQTIDPASTAPYLKLTILTAAGLDKTDVVFNTSGLALQLQYDNGARFSIALQTKATLASYNVSGTTCGLLFACGTEYWLDLPLAALTARKVSVYGTLTGAIVLPAHGVVDVATSTRLAPAAAGRALIVDTSGRAAADLVASGGSSLGPGASSGLILMGNAYGTDGYLSINVASVWGFLTSGVTTPGSIGKRILDYLGGGSKVAATIASNDMADIQGARAAKIDNADVATSSRASQSSVNNIATALSALANQTDTSLAVPATIIVPTSGTLTHRIAAVFVDADTGNAPVNMDTLALTVVNPAGTDRSGRLSAAVNDATGRYHWTYTSTAGDTQEQLVFEVVGVKTGDGTWRNVAAAQLVDKAIEQYTATDRARDNAVSTKVAAMNPLQTDDARLPAGSTPISTYTGADTAGTGELLARLTAGRATNLDYLDAAMTSRPTAAQVATAVGDLPAWKTWHMAAQATQDVQQLAGLMGDTIAAIGTRASTTALSAVAASVSTVGGNVDTLIRRLTDERAQNLDHLDVDVSEAIAGRETVEAIDDNV